MSKSNHPIEVQPKHLLGAAVFLLAAPLLAYLVFSGCYSVAAHEQAVVLRFGKYLRTDGPGLHFKVPWIEQRYLVDQGERSLRLPHVTSDSGARSVNLDEQEDKLILTGDLYAAVVEWNVIWRVTEPKDYLFNFNGDTGSVNRMIVAVARSVMHQAVGDYSAEELLTGKREEITQIALKELSVHLTEFGSGISITDLQMQRVTPPDRVRAAFDEVNASIQQRDQLVNEAYRERNRLIPAAEAQRDRLTREAEGYASRKSAEAQGEISALLAKFESYKLAPEITRDRLYLEMMERVLQQSGPKIILGTNMGSALPVLNLNSASTPIPAAQLKSHNENSQAKPR
ncbi:MAG: FtsH protease activity modulator HflK [Pirellula sp.]